LFLERMKCVARNRR